MTGVSPARRTGKRGATRDRSDLGSVIQAYMDARGIGTHAEMATILGVDRTLVTKYVSGARQCHDINQLRRFAGAMDLPPETFGLLPKPDGPHAGAAGSDEANRWRLIRQTMNRHRSELTAMAADLYWDPVRIEGTACVTTPGWMPDQPVDVGDVELLWVPDAAPPVLDGAGPETAQYRPHGPTGARYARYNHAIRALAAPALFENRGSYRLLDLSWQPVPRMSFGYTTYFDMIDVCEVLAHELATVWLRRPSDRLSLEDLPFRKTIGDLFNLARRPVLPSINTLTIRRAATSASFFLHRRNPTQVAVAGGQSHVIPAGNFQPSGITPRNLAEDFDLWRNTMREFSEEMLGNPEHDGSAGDSIDYDGAEPFRTLSQARQAGRVRPWCLGVGLDPLVPAGEILTVVVMDAEVFDAVFAGMVDANAEGQIVPSDSGHGIPWTSANLRRLLRDEPLACAAAACIALTWKHRGLILEM